MLFLPLRCPFTKICSTCWMQEYNTEAAFSASVLLSCLALLTLGVKEIVGAQAAKEVEK
jgi:ABC-type sulfate transport system permease subunit